MLRRLEIESYGLIARADVEFAEGATIFTGETGSGKTMLLGALDFALGGRAGADAVRRGARKASIVLTFDTDDALRARLADDGFALDPGEEGTIARELSDAGRSSLRINGRPATAGYAREIADAIAEIVGQHEAQRLLAPAYHLELLDRFGGEPALSLRDAVRAAYARAEETARELDALAHAERDARERYDEALYTVREIEEAKVDPAEIERIAERRRFLDNVEKIVTALACAREALAAGDAAAIEMLGNAAAALNGVAAFGADLQAMSERAASLQTEAGELAADVARALEDAEFDPAELDAINARLALVERLKRKYGVELTGLAERLAAARARIEAFEHRDERLEALRAANAAAERELGERATQLGALRRKTAEKLRERVVAQFAEIALKSGRFEIALEPLERVGPFGGERIEFRFAANAGEPARTLGRVASGGELSRVLLALVVALAQARNASGALVFDEIDAGIGGATATAVGARIGELAEQGQVVCVTHLAQLATWADRHYVLDKTESGDETTIFVRALTTTKEREAEIARMLSGETHDVALRHARALLVRRR